jgi:ABC-type Fe3+/spermidine/putrescine transport system ATPase subunit
LDRNLRERLVLDLRDILRRSRQTALYVTHDQEEAFVLANRVVVMNAGQVEQVGAPQLIYRLPASLFVARFLGLNNLLPGEIAQESQQQVVRTPIGTIPLNINSPLHGKVTVLLRPDAVHLAQDGACQLTGTVIETIFRGSTCRTTLAVEGVPLTFDLPANLPLPYPGESISLCFEPREALQVFPRG